MGPDHHQTLMFMSNLAEMYSDAKRWPEAIALQDEAYKLARAKLGPENIDTLTFMNRLVKAYLAAGRLSDAETTARECLRQREATKPEDWARFYTMSQLGAARRPEEVRRGRTVLDRRLRWNQVPGAQSPSPTQEGARRRAHADCFPVRGLGQSGQGSRMAREARFARHRGRPETMTLRRQSRLFGRVGLLSTAA